MNLFVKLLCAFFCLSGSVSLFGQDNFYFSSLNVKEGLSHSTVTNIFQDADGYLWFGTSNGLNKFDGYNFSIYRKNKNEKQSLSSSEIQKTIQDTMGNIWVLTSKGMDKIDYQTDEITHYNIKNQRIKDILRTRDGKILAFTNNLLYTYEPDSLRNIPLKFTIPSPVSVVTEDSSGSLYIGTDNGGIFVCDSSFRLTNHLHSDDSGQGLSDDLIRYMLIDRDNKLWIILNQKGIECYDPSNGKFTKASGDYYTTIGRYIRAVIEWDNNHLLLATFNGLAMLNKTNLTLTPVQTNLGEKGGLSHYSIYNLYRDRQQTLWVGTYSGGVNYHNHYNNRFKFIIPKTFSGVIRKGQEARDGVLWFATEGGGLLAYNPKTGEQENYFPNPSGNLYYNNLIKTILIDNDTIFCSTFGGKVYLFEPRSKTFKLLYDFGYNDIYTLYRDSRKRLWIPTHTKAHLVVADGKKLYHEFDVDGKKTTFPNTSVIRELSGERFLIGTRNQGFYLYNSQAGTLQHFAHKHLNIPKNEKIGITDIFIDSQKDIWISSNGLGLWQLDSGLNVRKHYTQTDGLKDLQVFYVTEDPQGYLWIMTCHELYQLSREKGIVNRFNSKNGIELQEFSMYSGTMTRDGKLYLSGMNGFQYINPQELWRNTEKPPVLLTSLRINNREMEINAPGSPLSRKIQQTEKLVLNYNQTNLSIGYTALNYIYPEQNQYAYRMEGIDPEWNYVGNRREAFYSNLEPGRYHFRVIASNNDGVWNREGKTLEIEVVPPYWQRWWAYLLYLCAIGVIIWKFADWRHRKHHLENQLRFRQLEQEKQEEINQERSRFFTHITHEFRTPLTLIMNPADDLLEKTDLTPEIRGIAQLIRKNTQRLLSLVNNLMDIQKHESGKKELQISRFDFREFMQEIYYNFQATAPSRGIELTLTLAETNIWVTYDKTELEKVFFNLLSNAFKFTPSGGSIAICCTSCNKDCQPALPPAINLNFSDTPEWLFISICDSGIGIRQEDAQKLFEPFYQSANDLHQKTEGSGIGLSLSRMIVEQHHGRIFARPSLQGGTEMSVLLPRQDDPSIAEIGNLTTDQGESHYSQESSLPGITVLLVEDNPEILSYMSKKLSESYHVLTATNGCEALEITSQQFPDIIVSDVMMPVMNGIELCSKIKATLTLSHIPVILLTAKSMVMHIEEGFNAGADDYIIKPFNLSLLKVRIRNLLINHNRMKENYLKRFSLENIGIKVESVDDNFMNRYIDIVRQNIADPELDVDTICREIGMSRANFYRKVKAVTTLSPVEMIRNIRLENAVLLLKERHLSISEIAFKIGFSNHSYFTSCFKNLYGVSPTEFQEKDSLAEQ